MMMMMIVDIVDNDDLLYYLLFLYCCCCCCCCYCCCCCFVVILLKRIIRTYHYYRILFIVEIFSGSSSLFISGKCSDMDCESLPETANKLEGPPSCKMLTTFKHCPQCLITKPTSSFGKSSHSKTGIRCWCLDCSRACIWLCIIKTIKMQLMLECDAVCRQSNLRKSKIAREVVSITIWNYNRPVQCSV